ncbi:peptidylprolyl isomerase [Palleronia sp. LCG004]|uniref:peptidylprolyl isomerase n=1 Tax=Palleronia sp. LCG004 TaxID=3079304 RepID=UPI00294220C1|nr:peptidylprolyl isomerase [Palleronia sp. LCG004]WOI55984.1 peptidylprolyl isomerase [Palleronia sp. LCG004]
MSKLKLRAAICALSVGLAGPLAAQDASTVVATVDGVEITLGNMIAYRQSLGEQAGQMPPEQLYDAILDQMLSMTTLAAGRTLDDADRFYLENEERSLLARAAVNELSQEEVSDEEIRAAYEEAFGGFEGTQEYNASHILVETEEEAQALLEELEGGADFAELARANSTGPSGPSGGELGWFGPGQMVPAFDQAVQDMSVGDLAGPVQTEFGWHVIRLNDSRNAEAPPLEEVREQLGRQILNTRIAEQITAAREAADIEMSDTDFDPSIINDTSLLGR